MGDEVKTGDSSWKQIITTSFKSTKKKIPNMFYTDIRKPLYTRTAEDEEEAQLRAEFEEASSSGSGSESSSDEEYDSLTNEVRRRLSALAYKVQLRKDTFRDEHSANDLISVIEKRLQAKKEKEEEEDLEDKSPGPSQKGLLAIICYLFILLIAHLGASIYCFTNPDSMEHPHACLTPNCRRIGESFKNAMDASVNPCDDFYLYVCGNFIERNKIFSTTDIVHPSFVDGIPYVFDGNLKLGMFLKPVKKYPENQVLPFYKSCIHQKRRDEQGFAPFIEFLSGMGILNPRKRVADIPNISRLIARVYKSMGRSFFIDVFETIRNYVAIGITKPPSELTQTNTTVYALAFRNAFKLMKQDLLIEDEDELDTVVYYVMRFEAELYKLQFDSHSSSIPSPHLFGYPEDMDNQLKGIIKIPSELPRRFQKPIGKFSWTDFLDELFVKDSKEKEKPEFLFNYLYSILTPHDRTNVLILEELIAKTPFYIICRYFQWSLIKEFKFDLTSELQNIMRYILPSNGLTDTERCFRSLFSNLNVLSAERFLKDMDNFESVDRKMAKVLNVFMTGLVNITMRLPENFHEWMLENFSTLKVTVPLSSSLSQHIPEYYAGLNVSEKQYFKNVIHVRAIKARNEIYRIRNIPPFQDWPLGAFSLNEITMTSIQDERTHLKFLHVPFGGLYEPFIGNDLPVLDFGGFGYWVVSFFIMYNTITDILQYFATEGGTFEPTSLVTSEKFMEMVVLPRFECIQDSFGNIDLPELPGQKINRRVTHINLQMFADALAVEALTKVQNINRNNDKIFPRHQILPGFEHYTPEQLLFHSIARQSCVAVPKATTLYQMQHGPIPYHLRINGAFRLSSIFAKTWRCPRNSAMNPSVKCNFFEPYKEPVTDWQGMEAPSIDYVEDASQMNLKM